MRKDFLKKYLKTRKLEHFEDMRLQKSAKYQFLQRTRVKNNISENGFGRVVQFTLVHVGFDGLRILYRLDQAT